MITNFTQIKVNTTHQEKKLFEFVEMTNNFSKQHPGLLRADNGNSTVAISKELYETKAMVLLNDPLIETI